MIQMDYYSWPRKRMESFSLTKTNQPILSLKSQNLEFKTSTKFLWLIFHKKLKWTNYFLNTKQDLMKTLNQNTKLNPFRTVLLQLSRSLIKNKIQYVHPAFSNASRRNLAIQNAGLRSCTYRCFSFFSHL